MTEDIQLVGTLTAVAGDDLYINCTATEEFGNVGEIILRENGRFADNGIRIGSIGQTRSTFILVNTEISDNGRTFYCTIAEFSSPPRSITIFCKSLHPQALHIAFGELAIWPTTY